MTVIVNCCELVLPTASVTLIVTVALPPVGVPLMVTELVVLDPIDKPGGSVPVTLQVNGAVPPLALMVLLSAVPAVAVSAGFVVIDGRGFTVICTLAVFVVSLTEVAVTVAVNALVTLAGAT